jgi:hypothetical protein
MSSTKWKLLRTKTDETVDDTDWAGTNTPPDDSICGSFEQVTGAGMPAYTGFEVIVIGVTASRVPVARSTDTVALTLVEVIQRDIVGNGGTAGDAPLVLDTASIASVPLLTKVYFPLGGSEQFTIRVTGDATFDGTVDRAEIWWRPVCR